LSRSVFCSTDSFFLQRAAKPLHCLRFPFFWSAHPRLLPSRSNAANFRFFLTALFFWAGAPLVRAALLVRVRFGSSVVESSCVPASSPLRSSIGKSACWISPLTGSGAHLISGSPAKEPRAARLVSWFLLPRQLFSFPFPPVRSDFLCWFLKSTPCRSQLLIAGFGSVFTGLHSCL
jgi:hypothetical protein